jgi:hypothetical protein
MQIRSRRLHYVEQKPAFRSEQVRSINPGYLHCVQTAVQLPTRVVPCR